MPRAVGAAPAGGPQTIQDNEGGLPAQVLLKNIGEQNIGKITKCTMKYVTGDFKQAPANKIHIEAFKSKVSQKDFVRIPVKYEVMVGKQKRTINSYVYTNILLRPNLNKNEEEIFNAKIGIACNLAKCQLKALGQFSEKGDATTIQKVVTKSLLLAAQTRVLSAEKDGTIKKGFFSVGPGVCIGAYKVMALVNAGDKLKPTKNPEYFKRMAEVGNLTPNKKIEIFNKLLVDYKNCRKEVENISEKLPDKLNAEQLSHPKSAVHVELQKVREDEYKKSLVNEEIKKAEEALKELGEEIQKAENAQADISPTSSATKKRAAQNAVKAAFKWFPEVYNTARRFIGAAELIASDTPSVHENTHKKLDSLRSLLQGYKENKIFATLDQATKDRIKALTLLPVLRLPRPAAPAPAAAAPAPGPAAAPAPAPHPAAAPARAPRAAEAPARGGPKAPAKAKAAAKPKAPAAKSKPSAKRKK